jgi:hypothetical protein
MATTKILDLVTQPVRHPVRTALQGIGVGRAVVGIVARVVSGGDGGTSAGVPAQRPPEGATTPHASEDAGPPLREPLPAAEERAPEPPHESFATEPSAVTRASAHGGGGRDDEIDDWYAEADAEDDLPDTVVEALEANDPPDPGPDESAIKQALSESEILRRAADPE